MEYMRPRGQHGAGRVPERAALQLLGGSGNGWLLKKLGTPGSGEKNIDGFKVSLLVIIPMILIINTLLFSEGLKTIGFLYR